MFNFNLSYKSKFANRIQRCLEGSNLSDETLKVYWRAYKLYIECFSQKKSNLPSETDIKIFGKFLHDKYNYSHARYRLILFSLLSLFHKYSRMYEKPFDHKSISDIINILVVSYESTDRTNNKKTAETLSDGELKALEANLRKSNNLRMELLIHLAKHTGYRRIDLINLRLSNITIKNKSLIIDTTIQKTNRLIQTIVRDQYTTNLLRRWIKESNLETSDLIFHSVRLGVHYKASPWTRPAFYAQFHRILKECGIYTIITLVSFRKRLAQTLYNLNTKFSKIKETLGWVSNAGMYYIQHGMWIPPTVTTSNTSLNFNDIGWGKRVPWYLRMARSKKKN